MRSCTGGGVVEYGEMGVGVFCKKVKKVMEDAYKVVLPSKGNSNKGFYGVYDGHGGLNAEKFVAENLHENILKMLENYEGNVIKEEAVKAGYLKTDDEFWEQALDTFNTAVISPVYYVMFTSLTIFASIIMFKDWSTQNASQIGTELCGFVNILSGTYLLHKTKDMGNSTPKKSVGESTLKSSNASQRQPSR